MGNGVVGDTSATTGLYMCCVDIYKVGSVIFNGVLGSAIQRDGVSDDTSATTVVGVLYYHQIIYQTNLANHHL